MVNLEDRGLDAFCPFLKLPVWHRRAPRGPVPLFPCYLFVSCQPDRHLHLLRYCPGVGGPLIFDGVLALVSDELVGALRERERGRGYIEPRDFDAGFAPGRKVRVNSGPLSGLQGVFVEYVNGCARARILVEFLRRQTAFETESIRLSMAR